MSLQKGVIREGRVRQAIQAGSDKLVIQQGVKPSEAARKLGVSDSHVNLWLILPMN